MSHHDRTTRREFGRIAGRGLLGAALAPGLTHLSPRVRAAQGGRIKVAAVVTECSYRSHAHVILENFLEPYYFNGKVTDPGCDVVSLYLDQVPQKDMGRAIAADYKIPIYPTIAGALGRGGDTLAVDAVLSIGEHGKYPLSPKGQIEYPRKRFFDEIVAVFERSGRVAPVFSDKHLSYRYDWAEEMYRTAGRLKIPFMAGSSVPLATRRPPLEIPPGSRYEGAVSIHGGPLESYGFHGLEVLQSFVEARAGGEAGVESVRVLRDQALWEAAEAGLWSVELADAAMAAELGPGRSTFRELLKTEPFSTAKTDGILVQYRDGLRAIVLNVGHSSTRWNFACRVAGEAGPRATSFYVGPWENRNLFRALSHAIQAFFRDREAPYRVERTLLTTGVLDAAMTSHLEGGRAVPTPELAIAYRARDFRAFREMGATWEIINEATPQPLGVDTRARRVR